MSDEKTPEVTPEVKPTRLRRRIFLWIFRKQVADIIHTHTESIQLRHTIKLHKSGLSSFIEALEFVVGDIANYFKLGSGLSARRAMKEMQDFCSFKLETLRNLFTEYEELEEKNEGRPKKTDAKRPAK